MVCFPITPGQTPMPLCRHHSSLPASEKKSAIGVWSLFTFIIPFRKRIRSSVGLPGIEPGLHAPHACVLPVYYSPNGSEMDERSSYISAGARADDCEAIIQPEVVYETRDACRRQANPKSFYYRKAQMPTTSFHSRIFLMMNGRFALLPSCPAINRAMRSR